MALNDINEKILSDAKKEAQKIITSAVNKSAEIEQETETLLDEQKNAHDEKVNKKLEDIERIALSEAKQTAKKQNEKFKEQALNKVFEGVLNSLNSLDSNDYIKLVTTFIKDIETNVSGVIEAPESRIKETQQALHDAFHSDLEIRPTDKITGGFIFTGEKVRYDYSFESIVSDAKEKLTIEAAQSLFE